MKLLYRITPKELEDYEKNSVYFTKPRLVAWFRYSHGQVSKNGCIKYFKMVKTDGYPLDLNEGFETYIPRANDMYLRSIDFTLKYDMSSAAIESVEKTKIFTRRGTIGDLMQSFYARQYDLLKIHVSRYNNNLYIVKEKDDESKNELKPVNTHHARLQQLFFADSLDGEPELNQPMDENILLVGVHRSNFGQYDMIYSGEIQGIIDTEPITNMYDMDDLTNRRFVLVKQMWNYIKNKDNKFLDYWVQSYLANVIDIYIGYKNGCGIIDTPIEHYFSKDLPKNRNWKPAVCTGFLYGFLQHVEKVMSSVNCLYTVYVFHYNQKSQCFTYEVFKNKTDKSFISEEYIEFCNEDYNF